MREPDFFIIGAPKCGTTALSDYLRSHPRIFMPFHKEPHYFASEMADVTTVNSLQNYLDLFEEADDSHQAVGEASVHYLRSSDAILRVNERYPNARFIVMFRDPITFLPSWHNQLCYSLMEDECSFEEAWSLRGERALGRRVPRGCHHPMFIDYVGAIKFGEQVNHLLSLVPRERVFFLKFEDFIADVRYNYVEVLRFLGVEDDGRQEFKQSNPAHQSRSRMVNLLLTKIYRFLSQIIRLKRDNPIRALSRKVLGGVKAMNTTYRRPEQLPETLQSEIRDLLQDDMALLKQLTGITWDWVGDISDTGVERD